MATDHTQYLEEGYETFLDAPGFPYMRMNSALLSDEADAFSTPGEQLLLTMHCSSALLAVVSTERIIVYKLPKKKSWLRSGAGFGVGAALDFVPVVGDLLDAGENVMSFGRGLRNVKHWISPGDRRKAAQDAADGLPSRKERRDVVWDLRDAETLALIVTYRDNILLKNGFEGKTKFGLSMDEDGSDLCEIAVGHEGVSFKTSAGVSGDYSLLSAGSEWDPVPVAELLVERNQEALGRAGWIPEVGEETVVFRSAREPGQESN